jgi:uncharacterized protein (TIGR04222 family)
VDWLAHDITAIGVGDMYGPHFLVLYGCVIAITLGTCLWVVCRSDRTGDLPPLPVPKNPDPGEIAYLRGGANEVIRLVMFDLIQRGYLEVIEKQKHWWNDLGTLVGLGTPELHLAQVRDHPDLRHLSAMEREVFDPFSTPRKAFEVFREISSSGRMKQRCDAYEERIRGEQLLCPTCAKAPAWIGAIIIGGLGGYKLWVTFAQGRSNVFLLFIMGGFGLALLAYIFQRGRLSERGKRYLERLQQAFERVKERATVGSVSARDYDPTLLLLVGLFGVRTLAGTPYDRVASMFRGAPASGSGCGGGCGSCGGGGCGGGCGGCGGCGG